MSPLHFAKVGVLPQTAGFKTNSSSVLKIRNRFHLLNEVPEVVLVCVFSFEGLEVHLKHRMTVNTV